MKSIIFLNFSDVIACIDRNTLQPVDISRNFPPLYQGKSIEASTLTNNDSNLIVFAFIASNIKEYSFDNRNTCIPIPLGYMAQKVEQLQLLGYQTVMVWIFAFSLLASVSLIFSLMILYQKLSFFQLSQN